MGFPGTLSITYDRQLGDHCGRWTLVSRLLVRAFENRVNQVIQQPAQLGRLDLIGDRFGSLLVLVASTWVALRIGARLFRVGLLLTGARPKLREILRQARLS